MIRTDARRCQLAARQSLYFRKVHDKSAPTRNCFKNPYGWNNIRNAERKMKQKNRICKDLDSKWDYITTRSDVEVVCD